jgi:hypothetical protein
MCIGLPTGFEIEGFDDCLILELRVTNDGVIPLVLSPLLGFDDSDSLVLRLGKAVVVRVSALSYRDWDDRNGS